ncbi:hypothetical protein Q31b_01180 [Novipirellula aureliae]|uniref:Uncharacterized protein n=1 Tax=Novipirellula aureliae TaxID=2527966 RepID=A0A5C6EAF0_9BACT|nr:hypothetical protein Q31b_01180 [Novipirellula aureliae]
MQKMRKQKGKLDRGYGHYATRQMFANAILFLVIYGVMMIIAFALATT